MKEKEIPTAIEIEFDNIIENTLEKIRVLLTVKGKEYRRNNNPYHNFEVAAKMNNCTREQALHGFALKHLVSISDIRNDIANGKLPNIMTVEEKFGDIITYFLLEKASIINKINQNIK